ncbi:MAG: AAA-like domain-containing protein, partial [Microcystaceae cyanobacterium]
FIDEIDSILSLPFAIDDFFAFIRYCYNQRALDSQFNRLTFALFGVATPSDLIQDRKRTPFNIGKAIQLEGFTLTESQILIEGLPASLGNRYRLMERVIWWTNGQPFLTQKLCRLIVTIAAQAIDVPLMIPPGNEDFWVDQIVEEKVINFWQSQDNPEHFRTIRDRLFFQANQTGRLLGIYQQLLQEKTVYQDDSPEQTILLLSGLALWQQGLLKIKNPLYENIFDLVWVNQQLALLRPYSQNFDVWLQNKSDRSRLLRGQALLEAKQWAKDKSLDNLDYQFLSASEDCDRLENQRKLEIERTKAIEIQLEEKQKRLVQEQRNTKLQRYLLLLLTTALILVSGLGIFAFLQYRQAKVSETEALISSSEGLSAANNQIGAMVAAIKAQLSIRKLKQLNYQNQTLNTQSELALRQTVYGNNEVNRLIGHKGSILSVDVSPDDSLIATASNDKTVKLWGQNGSLKQTLKHTATVHRVAFSPNGRQLVTGTLDGRVWIWRRDGTLLKRIEAHKGPVWGVAFNHGNAMVASASADGTAKLWSLDGTLLHTLRGGTSS